MAPVRLATFEDIPQLVQMRWDFSKEEQNDIAVTFEEFNQICSEFLVNAIQNGEWLIWVAERNGCLVSHMYLQIIHKVPRPGKSANPYFGYVTNVYTRPAYRNQGIGSEIHRVMEQWSKENKVEFLVLWPSSDSVPFYSRNGFLRSADSMEKHWDKAGQ